MQRFASTRTLEDTASEDRRSGWPSPRVLDWSITAALLLVVPAVYAGLLHAEFINFDDPQYVTDNAFIRSGLGWQTIRWALTTGHCGTWHPLTWISHALDSSLFGLDPGAHHLTSVVLHAVSSATLFWVLRGMTGARGASALVAALFALHPINVGSVAWISERKNVLSTLFLWLTIGFYARHARAAHPLSYVLALLCFGLGLSAKPMLVTLPFLLLVLEIWPFERVWVRQRAGWSWTALARLTVDKIPFFVLAALTSVVTFVLARREGAVESLTTLPLSIRLANTVTSYAAYLWKTIWPTRFTIYYPYELHLPAWQVTIGTIVIAVTTTFSVWQVRRHPYVLAGWLWYLGTLAPVIGIVQIGSQSMADRYAYVPLVGIFIAVTWLGRALVADSPVGGRTLAIAALFALSACAVRTAIETTYWRNSETLFSRAIAVTRDNVTAHDRLAAALRDKGDARGAIVHFEDALRIQPRLPEAQNDLGNLFAAQGRVEEAIALYRAALRDKPNLAQVHFNLGLSLAYRGDAEEATREYREALRLAPTYPEAHYRLAGALAQDGDVSGALAHYQEALRARPHYPHAHHDLGNLLSAIGRQAESVAEYRAAIRDEPNFGEAHFNLGRSLEDLGDMDASFAEYERAVGLLPELPEAHYYLAGTLERRGAVQEAAREYANAVRLRPTFEAAHRALAGVLAALGDADGAAMHLAVAEQLRGRVNGP